MSVTTVLSLTSCETTTKDSADEFYKGLKMRHAGQITEAIAYFEQALGEQNTYIAAAAATELLSLFSAGAEISAMEQAREKTAGIWAAALDALEQPENKEKILDLVLGNGSRPLDEASLYALREFRTFHNANAGASGPLSAVENAVVDGRIAAARSSYTDALAYFRIALADSPLIFFRYPLLITDLGNSFQYTATGREGIELFQRWEREISANAAMRNAIPAGEENNVRYRLVYHMGRIARQRGQSGIEFFERAVPLAQSLPGEMADPQINACIWYILDGSLEPSRGGNPDRIIRNVERYAPQWRSDTHFADVFDRLARELLIGQQWGNMLRVFTLVRNSSRSVTARFAWIIGRSIEDGLFSGADMRQANTILASEPATVPGEPPGKAFLRIAYNVAPISATLGNQTLYFRWLGAVAVDEPFLSLPVTSPAEVQPEYSDALLFLLGFFDNDAVQFAPRFIRAMENDISTDELRCIAGALAAVGQYQESIRMVSAYSRRNGHQITRRDMELSYPNPHREYVEHYARIMGIEPAVMFGLIRIESAFNPIAVSRSGAVGLTQLMPATAREVATRIRNEGGPDYFLGENAEAAADNDEETANLARNMRNPAANIHIGTDYLAYLINNRMHDLLLALHAYNGGFGRVNRWRAASPFPVDLFAETIPITETRGYGRNVLASAAVYRELYYR
ncbi:MAG: lytic transglycosylase domain-containing protein [Treponema sp.]|nr:lytic transglycosylase domain-containing protein [Treponema sp.]